MLIKQLKLENIRSYVDGEFSFPEGTVLLAGDIGSGKSTLLLAIEFALFGLKTGELSGGALLRHGAHHGTVELAFEIEGKEYVISRRLKRGKDAIVQDKGFLAEQGAQAELMQKELKAKILEILNYPESVQGKSQDLIYRFTVYTPQEEMKRIIYESPETRLETLRKVFNVDRYRRVQENIGIFAAQLREQSKELQGRIADLPEKKSQAQQVSQQIAALSGQERQARGALERLKPLTLDAKAKVQQIENEMRQLQEMRKEHSVIEAKLQALAERKKRAELESSQYIPDIGKLKEELKDAPQAAGLEAKKKECEAQIDAKQQRIADDSAKFAVVESKLANLKKVLVNIRDLDTCTLCLQKVPHNHKEEVLEKGRQETMALESQVAAIKEGRGGAEKSLAEFKQLHKSLSESLLKARQNEIRKAALEEKEAKLEKLKEELIWLEKDIAELGIQKTSLQQKIEAAAEIQKRHDAARKAHDEALALERRQELAVNSVQKEREAAERISKSLEQEILAKERAKQELEKALALRRWLQDRFSPLVAAMERQVMLALHREFNDLFRRWFGILIEDDTLSVKLDDTFSVVAEQDGYESSVENLSGGEKTSVALAYRLALNRVINDVMSTIRTKDLLILDEPTEGFSSEQLDKVREVLDELGAKQVIIVSHESKVESFVDHVIRIEKHGGVSIVQSL